MDILVDANALWGDPLLQLGEWPAVWAYLESTGGKLLVPKVVRREATSNHAKRCQDARDGLEKRGREFQRLTGKRIVMAQPGPDGGVADFLPMPASAGDAEAYEARWEYLEGKGMVEILPYPENATETLVERGELGLPPQHNSKDNHRDGCIWLTLLVLIKARPREVAFISNDKSAFTAKGGDLEPRLQAELGDSPVRFCLGLKDFLNRFGGQNPFGLIDDAHHKS